MHYFDQMQDQGLVFGRIQNFDQSQYKMLKAIETLHEEFKVYFVSSLRKPLHTLLYPAQTITNYNLVF